MELAIVVEKLKNTIDALPPNERGILDAVVGRMSTLKDAELRDATPPANMSLAGPETDDIVAPKRKPEETEELRSVPKPNLTESESADAPRPNLEESEEG